MLPIIRIFTVLTLLTGVIYPLLVTGVAKLIAPHTSQGGLIEHKGATIGAELIAQKFKDPKYFWPRPSFIDYKASPSGGSNFALTNALLKKAVDDRNKTKDTPLELLFTSGSGLDPHISLNTAIFQIDRIAEARHIKKDVILELIQKNITFSYVNVLMLNLALDDLP